MKPLAIASAAIGALFCLVAVYSRFSGPPGLHQFGYSFASGSLLTVGNTFLLIAVLVNLWSPQKKD